MVAIEQLKSEISDKYLDDFKEQLWFLKSLVLLPIKDDVKKVLIWQIDLPQKFDELKEFWWWKNIINFVTPDIANQIFAFMKEKRAEIERRKTEEELQALKNEVLFGIQNQSGENSGGWDSVSPIKDSDQGTQESGENNGGWDSQSNSKPSSQDQQGNPEEEWENTGHANSVSIGVGTGAAWVWGTVALDQLVSGSERRTIISKLGSDKIKGNLNWVLETMRKQRAALKEQPKGTNNLSPDKIKGKLNWALEAMKKQRDALKTRLCPNQLEVLDKNIWMDWIPILLTFPVYIIFFKIFRINIKNIPFRINFRICSSSLLNSFINRYSIFF